MDKPVFQADCLPVLIGSLPIRDHGEAAELVCRCTPQIPLWIQLPARAQEGMIVQFLPGLPGLRQGDGRNYLDTASASFEGEVLAFYEEYLSVAEEPEVGDGTRFALDKEAAPGFFTLLKRLAGSDRGRAGVKGQITGPVTLGTSVTDGHGRALFYDERLLDILVKLVAMKARWQVEKLSRFGSPVLIFLDEPSLAGFGSSAYIGVSREAVQGSLGEIMDAVHAAGGLAGVHICSNSDWSLVLESAADIVSFDAYSFFDRFVLYEEPLKRFLASGRIVAWGIVPTSPREKIEKETVASLVSLWKGQVRQIEALGIERERLEAQSLITPSCGTGSLDFPSAKRVLELTRDVSLEIRAR